MHRNRKPASAFRLPRPFGGAGWIALIGAIVVVAFATYTYGEAQDNDMWWLFATGREIVQNGIPYLNPFSAYPDQDIVIQQWLPSVIDYLVYENFGFIGVGVLVFILTILLVVSAVALAKVMMTREGWLPIGLPIVAAMLGVAISYISIRPQIWSMIAFLLVLNVLERYRRGASPLILIWLPVLVAIHANFHLSMMPFDLFITACYLIPSFSRLSFASVRSSYKRLPLIAALVGMALATCANPYGINGALYLINSYGAAAYGNYILEMGATQATAYYGMAMVVFVMAGSAAIGKNGAKAIDVPLTILFIVTAFLAFQHVRNVWLVAIFAVALVFGAWGQARPVITSAFLKDSTSKLLVGIFGFVLVLATGLAVETEALTTEPEDARNTPILAADYLDGAVGEEDRSTTRVFTHFNAGGYIEWRGYQVGMDARPELWNDKISHSGNDRYTEYIDMSQNKIKPAEYMNDKDFDYLIVNTDTDLYKYLLGDSQYSMVVEGEGYVLFENRTVL